MIWVTSRSLRFILISAIVASWFIGTPTASYACSCIAPGSPTGELARSTAVFTAKVTEIKAPIRGPLTSSADPIKITFQVYNRWKGPPEVTLVATTPRSGASCGYDFQEGQDYIVYANGDASDLRVGLCSLTKPLALASADLEQLGPGITVDTSKEPGKDSETPADAEPLELGGTPETQPDPKKDTRAPAFGCNAPLHSGARGYDLSLAMVLVGLAGLGLRKRVP